MSPSAPPRRAPPPCVPAPSRAAVSPAPPVTPSCGADRCGAGPICASPIPRRRRRPRRRRSGRGSGLPELEREAESGELARMLSRIDGSRPLPAGTVAAVLAPPAAGVLVHEAVGHFAEAAPEGRADLTHRLGLRVASEGFDLVDDPLVAAGPASYRVD